MSGGGGEIEERFDGLLLVQVAWLPVLVRPVNGGGDDAVAPAERRSGEWRRVKWESWNKTQRT